MSQKAKTGAIPVAGKERSQREKFRQSGKESHYRTSRPARPILRPGSIRMSKQQLHQFLQSTGRIGAADAAAIAEPFVAKTVMRGELLLRQGQVSNDYFFLDAGWLRAFALSPEGQEVSTGFYQPGRMVLEPASFFTRAPAQENIQALTDCAGWVLTFNQFNKLFHARPEFREFGRGLLVQGFAGLKARMLEMVTLTAAERYAQLLRTSPELMQHVSVRHLASYLGITDTSLSRIRKG